MNVQDNGRASDIPGRLDALRTALVLNWRELYERLDVSERTLHYLRTGDRRPSSTILRKIAELEEEVKTRSSKSQIQARHPAADNASNVEQKQLDIVELKQTVLELDVQIKIIDRQISALRKRIEEVANGQATRGS